MMRTKAILGMLLMLVWESSCSQTPKAQDGTVVMITTDLGDIRVKLYDQTPLHRDNFVKLASEGFYDGVLFHRVIREFMVQAGDPSSRGAQPGVMLGNGGPNYTIAAEFVPELFHRKGALAAARQGDQVNPAKASSGSQFYIVQGKVWRSGELDTLELRMNGSVQQNIMRTVFTPVQQELEKLRQENNQQAFNMKVAELQAIADSLYQAAPKMKFSAAQREVYTTVGGTPHLDGGYTVFGEVVEGLVVIDKIAAVETDGNNRPRHDIAIKRMKVLK